MTEEPYSGQHASSSNDVSAPRPPRHFIGRKQLIEDIIAEITSPSPAPVIALLGMGGIGKTALAKQIAETAISSFPGGIFWGDELPARDRNPSIILKRWGTLCGQNLENEDDENLPSVVRRLLSARQAKLGPILTIVDDVRLDRQGGGIKAIDDALPSGIPLIITTRLVQIAQEIDAKVYNVNVLSRTESCQLLVSLSSNKISKWQAETFSELCGDMPLALELMAKLAKTRKSDWLLNRLQGESNRLEILKLDEAGQKEQSVKISLGISYETLAEQHPETARIFRYLAAFAQPAFIVYEHLVNALARFKFSDPLNQNIKKTPARHGNDGISSQVQNAAGNYENAVFVSYAWGGDSEKVVDDLEEAFFERGIQIIRDKREIKYRGSIKEFEERIGRGQCVILVISDKYLRSEHCMYELAEVEENKDIRKRIFPIVLSDAQIYKAFERVAYFNFWDNEIKQLNQAIKEQVDRMTNIRGLTSNLEKYERIRAKFDHLTEILNDMNALTPEIHADSGFSTLIDAVEFEMLGLQTVSQLGRSEYHLKGISGSKSKRPLREFIEDNLLRLADWSLLTEDKMIEGAEMEYFHMHSLLHDYAESLVDAKEMDEAIRSHILYCVTFAEANPQIDLLKQQKSTQEFERSYGQLLQAITQINERYLPSLETWEDHLELAEQVTILVDALDHHWQMHSQFDSQVEWLQVAHRCAGALGKIIKQADYARRVARVLSLIGELDEAFEWMNQSEEALGDNRSEEANAIRALMYIHRASIVYLRGELETAEKDCLRGLELVDVNGQPKVYAEGHNLLGVIKMRMGKLSSALQSLERSLAIWIQVGDQYQIPRVKENRRTVLYYLGRFADLRKEEEEGVKYWEQFPDRIELAIALTNRGLVHHIDGGHEIAIDFHQRAIELSDRLAVPRMQAMTRANIAGPDISLGKYDEAQAYLKKSLEIQDKYDVKEYWVDTQRSLAEVALGRKHYARAVEFAENALDLAKKDEDPLEEGSALRVLGRALHMNGKHDQAREHLEASLTMLRDNEFKYESYLTLQALFKLYEDMGDVGKAQAMTEEARSLSREMGLDIKSSPTDSG